MNTHELIGYLASLLVLMTFCMSGMVALRALAIASNVAFIAYAVLVGISPVLVLHALLLPMNAYRLLQAVRDRRRDGAAVRGTPADLAPTAMPTRAQSASEGSAPDEVTRAGKSLKRRRRRVPQVVEYSTSSRKLSSATANPGASADSLHAMRT